MLPRGVLAQIAAAGIYLPRTAFTYLNLGPLREKGIELSVDHRVSQALTTYANYSWQAKPTMIEAAGAMLFGIPPDGPLAASRSDPMGTWRTGAM